MRKAVQVKPDASPLWLELGRSLIGQARYQDALMPIQKAISLNSALFKPKADISGAAYNALVNIYAHTGKPAEASAAYESAATARPLDRAQYYTNEAIALNSAGNADATAAAAEKAIAADPSHAMPYYLKGQALIGKTTVDPKTNKPVPPASAVEAYQKYLELAPNGEFANEVKAILAALHQEISSSYSAHKGK